jgi:hypothetical protein
LHLDTNREKVKAVIEENRKYSKTLHDSVDTTLERLANPYLLFGDQYNALIDGLGAVIGSGGFDSECSFQY